MIKNILVEMTLWCSHGKRVLKENSLDCAARVNTIEATQCDGGNAKKTVLYHENQLQSSSSMRAHKIRLTGMITNMLNTISGL